MNRLPNIHPGEILREEFLTPMGISQYRLAKAIGVPAMRISEICAGKRSVTADTALRFSRAFGTTPGFWLGLQDYYVNE
ncbi:MAG: HigA family addiction module antitoxin [Pseudomonadota bacterium]